MDADIVREIEFSRSLRGYNTAEVDAFLERMEGNIPSIRSRKAFTSAVL